MRRHLNILIVEDNQFDLELMIRELKKNGFEPAFEQAYSAETLKSALNNQTWDLVTCDYSMPGFSAPQALDMLKESFPELPVIIVSGEIDISRAVSLLKSGACDYVPKTDLIKLPISIERELSNAELRKFKRSAERELIEAEKNLRTIFNNSFDALIIHDSQGYIIEINQPMLDLYGINRQEALQLNMLDLCLRYSGAPDLEELWKRALNGELFLVRWKSRIPGGAGVFKTEMGLRSIAWYGQPAILASIRDKAAVKSRKKALMSDTPHEQGMEAYL